MFDVDPVKWRYQVLRKIYELAEGQMTKVVYTSILVHELGAESHNVDHILRYLDSKGLIKLMHNSLNIKATRISVVREFVLAVTLFVAYISNHAR
jgi:hypothetical protein